ncbi:MAG TPA: hypothetical protein DCZ69_11200 [Syntrophobacteraceae bacterium]|nr:hypothetical protein [Syntrophobacteraceae bacterium]
MSNPVWLARVLSVGAVVETVAGLWLRVDPSGLLSSLLRSPLEAPEEVASHRWRSPVGPGDRLLVCPQDAIDTGKPQGLTWVLPVYNVVACVTTAWMVATVASAGLPAVGVSVLHGVIGAALLGALLSPGKASTRP